MVLSINEAYDYMHHALGGGRAPVELDEQQILNRAADLLYGMHAWRWTVERTALLDTRGRITFTDGTWTAATKTLTSTGSFTNYTFVAGDEIEIEAGTGATTGHYKVASRVDDDSITLVTSLASGNLATGDIEGDLRLPTVALPSDFRDILNGGIVLSDSLNYSVRLVTHAQIIHNRTSQFDASGAWPYLAAVIYSGSPPVPILDIWPDPTNNSTGFFTLSYRRKWVRVTGDNDVVDIPEFVESLFLEILMAYVRGIVRQDDGTVSERMTEIMASPLFDWAKRQDGLVQGSWGHLRGGGYAVHGGPFRRDDYGVLATVPASPS